MNFVERTMNSTSKEALLNYFPARRTNMDTTTCYQRGINVSALSLQYVCNKWYDSIKNETDFKREFARKVQTWRRIITAINIRVKNYILHTFLSLKQIQDCKWHNFWWMSWGNIVVPTLLVFNLNTKISTLEKWNITSNDNHLRWHIKPHHH